MSSVYIRSILVFVLLFIFPQHSPSQEGIFNGGGLNFNNFGTTPMGGQNTPVDRTGRMLTNNLTAPLAVSPIVLPSQECMLISYNIEDVNRSVDQLKSALQAAVNNCGRVDTNTQIISNIIDTLDGRTNLGYLNPSETGSIQLNCINYESALGNEFGRYYNTIDEKNPPLTGNRYYACYNDNKGVDGAPADQAKIRSCMEGVYKNTVVNLRATCGNLSDTFQNQAITQGSKEIFDAISKFFNAAWNCYSNPQGPAKKDLFRAFVKAASQIIAFRQGFGEADAILVGGIGNLLDVIVQTVGQGRASLKFLEDAKNAEGLACLYKEAESKITRCDSIGPKKKQVETNCADCQAKFVNQFNEISDRISKMQMELSTKQDDALAGRLSTEDQNKLVSLFNEVLDIPWDERVNPSTPLTGDKDYDDKVNPKLVTLLTRLAEKYSKPEVKIPLNKKRNAQAVLELLRFIDLAKIGIKSEIDWTSQKSNISKLVQALHGIGYFSHSQFESTPKKSKTVALEEKKKERAPVTLSLVDLLITDEEFNKDATDPFVKLINEENRERVLNSFLNREFKIAGSQYDLVRSNVSEIGNTLTGFTAEFQEAISSVLRQRQQDVKNSGEPETALKNLARACAGLQSFLIWEAKVNEKKYYFQYKKEFWKTYNDHCGLFNCRGALPIFDVPDILLKDKPFNLVNDTIPYCNRNGEPASCSEKVPDPNGNLSSGLGQLFLLVRCQQCEAEKALPEVFEKIKKATTTRSAVCSEKETTFRNRCTNTEGRRVN